MACQEFDDGSSYCADDWGWEYTDADGNYSSGQYIYDSGGNVASVDNTGKIVAVGDIISSVFGGGRYGNYAPQRQPQYGGVRSGPYPSAVTANVGANRGGIGAGLNISTNTLMLIVGGVILFMLGTKRGR